MKHMNHETHIKSDPILDENNRAFCAVLTEKGTQSAYSININDFTPLIDQASIAWIDYIIEDFEKEAVDASVKASFSEQLVKRLLVDVRGLTRTLTPRWGCYSRRYMLTASMST
jgi:hypothetical protein